ncbi:hypothetical protein CFIMG_005007RAa [Ceratocystis fimbriata CBS 114723]|uniref:Uncharacterized protein n=1 Tax=Ceratocystis fimbriata CBS 114723 TaxID=1035309 RepID=A0A2C5X794_9PEZI|nr:hypothetical protein CFIMG_005007RAa [Ceratocystis fimbriata CBS 114723]
MQALDVSQQQHSLRLRYQHVVRKELPDLSFAPYGRPFLPLASASHIPTLTPTLAPTQSPKPFRYHVNRHRNSFKPSRVPVF